MNWDTIGKTTTICLDIFIELVEFCLNNSYFCFRRKFYEQTDGAVMGSPISPILADIVMEGLLKNVTSQITFPVPILKKYVDDLLLALPKDEVDNVLKLFNSYNSKLQFTMEHEKEGKIPFLDTVISINPDLTLSTEWYTKDISSGRLLNYFSFHPMNMKLNIARNFIKRVIQFDSKNHRSKQKTTIHHFLQLNNYPKTLINRLINRENRKTAAVEPTPPPNAPPHNTTEPSPPTKHQPPSPDISATQNLDKTYQPLHLVICHEPVNITAHSATSIDAPVLQSSYTPTQHKPDRITEETISRTTDQLQQTTPFRYFSLTYIPHLSNQIAKNLKKDFPNVKIGYNIPKTLGMLLPNPKDPVHPSEFTNVVYSIPCESCQQQYIGLTRNSLNKRISGHKSNINTYQKLKNQGYTNTDDEVSKLRTNATALLVHVIDKQHEMSLQNAKVIDKTRRSATLPILEMCHIYSNTNTMNFRTDVNNLSSSYANIIKNVTNTSNKKKHEHTTTTTID